jgi:glutamate-ammonia-ligase adenylyltransferase
VATTAEGKLTDSDRLDSLRKLDLPWGDPRFEAELAEVVSLSDYAFGLIQRFPQWLADSWTTSGSAPLVNGPTHNVQLEAMADLAEADWLVALRQYRHRNLLAILWRDINDLDSIDGVLEAQSVLAQALIGSAFDRAEQLLLARHGVPRDDRGAAQRLVVLALGKLGGGELNFSSDVDLVLAYPAGGQTDGEASLDNQEFFARQTRRAVAWLADRSEQGFVYRVDLRLRPFGDSGRTALSFAAMEEYYQIEGRDWERYAWIKARPVAGDLAAGEALLKSLRPFVYRRYLDYSAFESLRDMKSMIRAEVDRRQLHDDIKLGPGGIREIEFIAQAFQLIRGGREPELQDRRLIPVLDRLSTQGLLPQQTVASLAASYRFFRRLENRLQQVSDAQTHRLPKEPAHRQRLARSLRFTDYPALLDRLSSCRELVEATFAELFEQAQLSGAGDDSDLWGRIWDSADEPQGLADLLADSAFRDPLTQARRLSEFRTSVAYRSLGEKARSRLARFMPRLIKAVCAGADPDRGLDAVMRVVRAIASRSAYVALLTENPNVLERLVELCVASPWLTELVAGHPLLMDDLIDARLAGIAEPKALRERISERLASVEAGDLEAEMAMLHQVQQSQAMTIAVAALDGRVGPPQVAISLTNLAEAILDAVVKLAWRDLAQRHGEPSGLAPALAVIGYGTLGGRELNYTSDLDLVFLHRGADPGGHTLGESSIGNEQFFLRTSQRILHLLSTLTASGRLYEVDVRLRPNGSSGFLVSGLDTFQDYQRDQAWTWELQALTRARMVAGDRELGAAFEVVRRQVLGRDFEALRLADQVLDMRLKMRTELDRSDRRSFDIKHGPGGIVDIEFLAQWARLTLASQHPEVLTSTATIEAFESAACAGLMTRDQAGALVAAYRRYQRHAQQRALAGQHARVAADDHLTDREEVQRIWNDLLGQAASGQV